jgi:hypothetical protein
MGALGGSGGGTSQNASSKAYIPQAQGTADAGYQGLTHTLFDQANAGLANLGGITPAGAVYPTVQQTTQNVLNNPYQNQYVQGGQNAYDFFQQGQMPNIYQGSQQLAGIGNLAAGAAPGAFTAAQNPIYAGTQQAGTALSGPMQGGVMKLLGDIFNPQYQSAIDAGNTAAGKQFGAGDAIRTQAFDPQNALYNRTQARLSDQIGAGNANSGLAGTPYGESVRGNALGNFNIDWQNQQLQRMMQGGTAASGLDTAGIAQMLNPQSTASSAAASDLGAAGSGITSALDALLRPANAQVLANQAGASTLGSLAGTAQAGFGGANTLLGQGAQGMNQFAGLPYQNLNTTQGNNFGALQNQISLGNQAYALPQQVLNDLQSYLGLGQSASGLANSIGATNFGQLAQGVGGAANLGSQLIGGGSGLGGGIGSLFGGGAAGWDAVPALAGADALGGGAAAAGGGDFLSALAPAALSA